MSNSLQPHGLQHARLPFPSPTPRAGSNPCPLSQWCHPTIPDSVVSFSSHLQPFLTSRSFPMCHFFASGGHSIGLTASVLPMNIQDWSPPGWTGWISLQSKGLSRVFASTTVQKHQFFGGVCMSVWLSKFAHPLLSPLCPQDPPWHLHLYSCFAKRLTNTIFLDSISIYVCMYEHTIFVFLFLTDFV